MKSNGAHVIAIEESSQTARLVWEFDLKETSAHSGRLDILLVDDNPGDVRMVAEGLKETLPEARLSVARDGVEAIRFLRKREEFELARRPDLILLDLRLPKKSGFDVLRAVKEDPALADIPVVVQTCSESTTDVHTAYSMHANSYIVKPAGLDEYCRTMRILIDFWVGLAKLPDERTGWKTI